MTPASLKAWRKHLGLSQKAAAEAVGVSHRQYCYYESGAFSVPHTVALACAAIALGIRRYEGPQR